MQLREPKALGVLDHHDGRFRHIDADFDDRGRDEKPCLAGGEALHGAILVGAAHLAVDQIDRFAEPLLQRLVALLRRSQIADFGLFDQRTDPINAVAFVDGAFDRIDHLGEPLQRHGAGVDLLPARGFFPQLGNVHVAEIGQHQRARDRRRREHQQIDGLTFAGERQPLMHAEAVLLVDDGQRQIAEHDVILKQRMGADDEIDVADGEAGEDFRPLLAALAAGQDGDANAGGLGEFLYGGEVLPRQDFGWRHQRRLPAGFDHGRGGKQRHYGFSRADVAVKKSQHPVWLRKIGDNIGDGALLRRRERVGQRLDDTLAQQTLGRRAMSGPLPHLGAQQRQRELARQQFVIGEPRPRRTGWIEIVRRLRVVNSA